MATQLLVTLGDDGQLGMKASGQAAGNKLLLVGMLEMAKYALLAPPQQPAPPPIVLAHGSLPR